MKATGIVRRIDDLSQDIKQTIHVGERKHLLQIFQINASIGAVLHFTIKNSIYHYLH